MLVELTVSIDGFVITHANVLFITFPNENCPTITTHYRELIGLRIARGFNRKVRELFGGPRGCAHTSALLQAMAPAAIQTIWSLTVKDAREQGRSAEGTPEDMERSIAANLNTCHIWDENGQQVQLMRKGDYKRTGPVSVVERLEALGRDPNEWFS